jgi:hypothetical protein
VWRKSYPIWVMASSTSWTAVGRRGLRQAILLSRRMKAERSGAPFPGDRPKLSWLARLDKTKGSR